MIIMMNPVMWQQIADNIAFGTLVSYGVPSNIVLNTTTEGAQRERERVSRGGVGFGFIPIDGVNVPVIPEDRMGFNSTLDGEPAITSDILILTKRFRGLDILELQWLNWAALQRTPFNPARNDFPPEFFQNGMIKAQPRRLDGNDNCWYYGAEMYARIVTYMQPLQAVINDVTLPVDLEDENESGSFTSPNFYAFNGEEGRWQCPADRAHIRGALWLLRKYVSIIWVGLTMMGKPTPSKRQERYFSCPKWVNSSIFRSGEPMR
jgi:hypothetical protein